MTKSELKTRSFADEQKDELANMAETAGPKPMCDSERAEFDLILDEAAIELTAPNPRTPRANERKKLTRLAGKTRELARDITTLMLDLQCRVDLSALNALANNLDEIANAGDVKRGRPTNDGSFHRFLSYLTQAWEIGARSRAATRTDAEGHRHGGPFVEFVRTAAVSLKPDGDWDRRTGLGESVRNVLREIRATE